MRSRWIPGLVLSALALVGSRASGGSSTTTLRLDGAEAGDARFSTTGEGTHRTLVIASEEITAPVLGLIRAFIDGKGPKRNVVTLSTDAVAVKANDARLVEVRLPSHAGGATDVALTFEATTTTSPSLRLASRSSKPTAEKLAGFRLSIGALPTTDATRLDALVMRTVDAAMSPRPFRFDVPSRDAPRFVAWSKKPRPEDASVEYLSKAGEVLLRVPFGGCAPGSVEIDGPVTHVVVVCAKTRRG